MAWGFPMPMKVIGRPTIDLTEGSGSLGYGYTGDEAPDSSEGDVDTIYVNQLKIDRAIHDLEDSEEDQRSQEIDAQEDEQNRLYEDWICNLDITEANIINLDRDDIEFLVDNRACDFADFIFTTFCIGGVLKN